MRSRLLYTHEVARLFDLDSLDEDDPFEIDAQAAHLFKHPHLGVDDVLDVWASNPRSSTPRSHRLLRPHGQSGAAGPAAAAHQATHRADPGPVPARTLAEVKRRADADDRSVSAWIRRAVEHELSRPA